MKFKEIKQWSVSNGVATPVNPINKIIRQEDQSGEIEYFTNTEWIKFNRDSKYHTYATNAPDGVWDAEKLKLQRLCMYSWNKPHFKPVSEDWYQDMKDSTENVFKTELQLLIDIEVLENDKWIRVQKTQSELDEYKSVNKWWRLPFHPPTSRRKRK